MRLIWALALLLGLFGCARPAQALCVLPLCTCNVNVTGGVAFPDMNPLSGGNTDGLGTVKVSCGGVAGLGIGYTVALSKGAGSFSTRQMSSGANSLGYNLYADSSRTLVWGDGTNSTSVVPGLILLDIAGLSPPNTHTIYGRIPPAQTAIPASYSDTITITVTYN